MGRPGPKPVNIWDLQIMAWQWAIFLFALRDGQPGAIYRVMGPWTKVKWRGKVCGRRPSKVLAARVLPVEKAKQMPARLRTKDWSIRAPIFPKQQAWGKLKQARSVREVQQAVSSLHKWKKQPMLQAGLFPGEHIGRFRSVEEFLRALYSYAMDLIQAKRLRSYPKSDRPKSDDKRIQFFAKVLAGLDLGIRPAYTVKLLKGWQYPRGTIEQRWAEFLDISFQRSVKK